jgi:hypothetical protein
LAEAVAIVSVALCEINADRNNEQAQHDERRDGAQADGAIQKQAGGDCEFGDRQKNCQSRRQRFGRAKVFYGLPGAALVEEFCNSGDAKDGGKCESKQDSYQDHLSEPNHER